MTWRPSRPQIGIETPKNAEKDEDPLENFALKGLVESVLNEKLQSLSLATENTNNEAEATNTLPSSPNSDDSDNRADTDDDFFQKKVFAGDVCSVGTRGFYTVHFVTGTGCLMLLLNICRNVFSANHI